jgi:hypothetical protein
MLTRITLALMLVLLNSALPVEAQNDNLPDNEDSIIRLRYGNDINYHGGPVMHGTVNLYYIWYGDWQENSPAVGILSDFAKNIGNSPYLMINTSYWDYTGQPATASIKFGGSYFAKYLFDNVLNDGKILTDNDILAAIYTVLTQARLPIDENGVYFVITSADVDEKSGFCTKSCGWHTNTIYTDKKIKFAFIGNPERCLSKCSIYQGLSLNPTDVISPNGNLGADAMANLIAHELVEAINDPNNGDGWYDNNRQESADKCQWTFGQLYRAANNSFANMKIGDRDFMIQQNWVNDRGGYCATSWKPASYPPRERIHR